MKSRLFACVLFALCGLSRFAARAETVLLADSGTKSVRQYAVTNGVWTYEKDFAAGTYGGVTAQPFGVACDGRQVYVGDIGTAKRILAFELDGAYVGVLTNFDATVTPECLTFDPNGRTLYMSDAFGTAGDKIYRFNLETGEGGVLINTTGWSGAVAFNNPRGLAVDESGYLYVADRNANFLRQFSAETGAFVKNVYSVPSPQGLLYDYAEKNLLTVSTEAAYQRVHGVRSNGYYRVVFSSQAAYANSMGMAKIGTDLYYSSFGEKAVYRIDADGNRTTVVSTGLSQPGYLAVIPAYPLRSDDGLTAHWRFNDAPHSLYLASSVGAPGYRRIQAKGLLQVGASGVEGGAAWFNTYSRGEIQDSKTLIPATNDFSAFMWMGLTNTVNSQRHFLTCNNGQAGRCELGVDFDPASLKKLFWWHSGGVTLVSTNDVRDGKWHHVGIVRRADNFELWLDGAVETNAVAPAAVSQAENWRIGAHVSELQMFVQSGAFMDDLRVYDRALDTNEVSAIYTAFTQDPASLSIPAKPAEPVANDAVAESNLTCVVVAAQPGIGEVIGSPSFSILADGTYVASYDLTGTLVAHTRVCRSPDQGATWTQSAEISNLMQASLFTDSGALYLIGTQGETGNVRVHRSSDGGLTWTAGATVSTTNLFRMAAGPVVSQGGRLWKAAEDTAGSGTWPANARVRIFSAPEGSDLTGAGNWACSSPLTQSGLTAARRITAWLSGNLVVDRRGGLVDLLSTAMSQGATPEAAAVVNVTNVWAAPAFSPNPNFTMLPGAAKPFNVRYDAVSGRYWTLVSSVVTNDDPSGVLLPDTMRNRLALYSSYSLRDWCFHTNVLYRSDLFRYGFQKAAFAFDGNDLVALTAAAYEDGLSGASAPDKPNLLICHRVPNFRGIPKDKGAARVLIADAGANRIVRLCPNSLGQWCEDGLFAEGVSMAAPHGLAYRGETVYVSEAVAGGRILAFTRRGLFQRVVTQFPATNTPDALAVAPDGTLYVSDAFGTNGDKIFRVNPSTGTCEVWVDTTGWGGTLLDPRGVSCDGGGNVYVANYLTGNNDGYFHKFSPAGTLLATSAAFDRPRGVYWDTPQNRLVGSVFGSCDLFQLSSDLQTGLKIGDFSTWTQYLGIDVVNATVYFSNYDQGLVHWLKSSSTQGTIASGLKSPAHFVTIPEGGAAYPDAVMGTCVRVR